MKLISANSLRIVALVVAVALVGCGLLTYGQGTTGSLSGQVSDPSGAAVVAASVTLTNLGTNFKQVAKTDGTGVYLFKPVEPGNYSLTINAPGFATYVQKGIVITVNLYATLDIHLKLGATGETVSVTADAELINTTSAELGRR